MTITAYFGDDDQTYATIELAEAGDIAVLTGANTAGAALGLQEWADVCDVEGAPSGSAFLDLREAADSAVITGSITIVATIAPTEHADVCVINVIAPNSIIGHGKKFKIKQHDPKSIVIPQS